MNELTLINDNIVVKDDKGRLALAKSVETNIDMIEEAKSIVSEAENNFKTKLLNEMLAADFLSAKLEKYTISVAKGRNTEVFDKEAFIENEPDDIIVAFSTFSESKTFDVERFKAENPELYEKYCIKTTNIDVDTKKLRETMPNVYERYGSEVVSTKAPVLKIIRAKEKKQ